MNRFGNAPNFGQIQERGHLSLAKYKRGGTYLWSNTREGVPIFGQIQERRHLSLVKYKRGGTYLWPDAREEAPRPRLGQAPVEVGGGGAPTLGRMQGRGAPRFDTTSVNHGSNYF